MRKPTIPAVIVLCFLASCANTTPHPSGPTVSTATPETRRITSASVVHTQPQPLEITAGGAGEVVLQIAIQKGFHLNANPPTYEYLKATELEITPADGISAGKISYPSPVTAKFAFAEKPLAVYEGETQVKAAVKTDKTASKGNHLLPAVLRIQACDEQVCYPPGKIDLQLPVTIK